MLAKRLTIIIYAYLSMELIRFDLRFYLSVRSNDFLKTPVYFPCTIYFHCYSVMSSAKSSILIVRNGLRKWLESPQKWPNGIVQRSSSREWKNCSSRAWCKRNCLVLTVYILALDYPLSIQTYAYALTIWSRSLIVSTGSL